MNRVPGLTRLATPAGREVTPAGPAGRDAQHHGSTPSRPAPAARPRPALQLMVSPAVGEHAVLVTVPALQTRVAELEALVCELRNRLALLAEPGSIVNGADW